MSTTIVSNNPKVESPVRAPPANSPVQLKRTVYPLSKEETGNAFWKTMHTAAYQYPANPTQQDADSFKQTFIYLMKSFPCEECKSHAREFVKANPPPLGDRKGLIKWFCDFHNSVNEKTGKPKEDCSIVDEPGHTCTSCSVKSPAGIPSNSNTENKSQNGGQTNSPLTHQVAMKDLTSTFKSYKDISTSVIKELCRRDKLPEPRIVFRECPEDISTSCTDVYRDPETKQHLTTPTIYLNPYQFSPRTIVHEYEHYRRTLRGTEEEMFDENAVEQVARDIIAKEFPLDSPQLLPVKPIATMNDDPANVGIPITIPQRQDQQDTLQEHQESTKKLTIMQKYQAIKEARRRKYKVKKQTPDEGAEVVQVVPSSSMESAIAPVPPGLEGGGQHESHFPTYMMIKQRFEAERFQEAQDGDDKDGFFSGFDRLYEPVSSHLGLPARALNESFTSNFIASSMTTIAKSNLSPIGSLLFTSVVGTGMLLSNLVLKNQGGIALGDRRMLTDVSTNLMMNALNYANPKVAKKIMKDAKKLGGHLASMEFDKILPMLVESPFLKKSKYGYGKDRYDRRRRGSGSSTGGGGGPTTGDSPGGGVGGGLSAPQGTVGNIIATSNVNAVPGAGVVDTGGGSTFSPTIIPGNPTAQMGPSFVGGPNQNFFQPAPGVAEGEDDGPGYQAAGGPMFASQMTPMVQSPADLENMTFEQRLRFFERARGVGGPSPGLGGRFYPSSELHGRDFGIVQPRPFHVYEDENVYGSPNVDSDDGLPSELNPNYPYIHEDEEELFGGEARADLHGVRRNSMPYGYYDDDSLADMR